MGRLLGAVAPSWEGDIVGCAQSSGDSRQCWEEWNYICGREASSASAFCRYPCCSSELPEGCCYARPSACLPAAGLSLEKSSSDPITISPLIVLFSFLLPTDILFTF